MATSPLAEGAARRRHIGREFVTIPTPGAAAQVGYYRYMEDHELDHAFVTAVFEQAAFRGWTDVSLVEAAQDAGLPLGRVRARFPDKVTVLLRFGVMADQTALAGGSAEPAPRERLFDMLMLRFDALQAQRDGVRALMSHLRSDPATSALLYGATLRSMAWLLDAAGLRTGGLLGAVRVHGLLVLWLYALRAWESDDSADLAATMAAVDRGLDRAIQAEGTWPGNRASLPPEGLPALEEPVPTIVDPAGSVQV